MGGFLGALGFALLLLVSIFLHELGHYVTARWAGIKIRQFFVGFGPTIWSTRRGRLEVVEGPDGQLVERPETEYGIKAIPLGGFVKVLGMSPFEEVPPHEYHRSFRAAPAGKRALVLVAGSLTHGVTAFAVLVAIFSVVGTPDPDRPTRTIDGVWRELEGGEPAPAFRAGLRPGDEVVAVDGRPVRRWEQVRSAVRGKPGQPVELVVRRDGGVRRVRVVPAAQEEGGRVVGVIGVTPAFATERVGPLVAAGRSARVLGELAAGFVRAAPRAFTLRNIGLVPGKPPREDRPLSLVGAGRIAAGLLSRGQVALFFFFFVQVNLFIGIVNLLPLPPLDGGHLLMVAIEKVRGREVDQRTLVPIMAVVTSLLVIMAVSLLFQDIFSPIENPFQ